MPRPIRPRTHERLRPPALLDAMRGTNDISCCLEVVVRRCSRITTPDAQYYRRCFRPPMCMCMYARLKRPDPFL